MAAIERVSVGHAKASHIEAHASLSLRCPLGLAAPVRDTKQLTRLLCDKIETISPGFGIEVMTLAATVVEPLEQKQAISSLTEESTPDITSLIDVLMNRVKTLKGRPSASATA